MGSDLVHALRIRGVNVLTALEVGMIERGDKDHLDFATSQSCSLYSFNVRDYQFLHTQYLATDQRHKGIILAQQQRYSIGEQMRRLLRLIAHLPAEEMENRLEFLSRW
jgi:hypothetical protein